MEETRAVQHRLRDPVVRGSALGDRVPERFGAACLPQAFEHWADLVERVAALAEHVDDAGVADLLGLVPAVLRDAFAGWRQQAGCLPDTERRRTDAEPVGQLADEQRRAGRGGLVLE